MATQLGKKIEGFPTTQVQMVEWQQKYVWDKTTGSWYEKPVTMTMPTTQIQTLQKEAPETLIEPKREQFSSEAYYQTALQKFQTTGNWATPAPTTPTTPTPTTTPTLESIQAGLQQVAAQIPSVTQGIQTLTQAKETGLTITPQTSVEEATKYLTTTAPTLPSATATNVTNYLSGVSNEVASTRTAVENAYKEQIASLQQQQAATQAKIDAYMAKEETALGDIKTLTQPFQEQLEKSERERLKVEENYFANQNSVKELEDLLNQAMTDIQAAEGVTGLSAIRTPRVNQIKEDYEARAGVIEAVMAARNNQISVATNLIDRSINAIASDRNSQLTYYNTVLSFYDNLRTEEGNKLITLTAQERTYVNAQIGLLESDLSQAQDTANYVKQLMIDPTTAQAMESAGVTLNDSVEQINAKLSAYAYTKEVTDTSNTMAANGYTALLPQEVASKPVGEVTTLTDSKGQKTYWWKAAEVKEYKPPTSYEEFQLAGGEAGMGMSYAEWLTRKETIPPYSDVTQTLYNVGIPTNVSTTSGELTKGFQDKLVSVGIPLDTALGIWQAILEGNSLNDIRQYLAGELGQEQGFGLLDTFIQTLQGEKEEITNPYK